MLRTNQEKWTECVRLAAIRNRKEVAKAIGEKVEKKYSPLVQYAKPTR